MIKQAAGWRLAGSIGLCLFLTAPVPPASAGERSQAWAQERSDLEADPGVLFGKLPNGMRYAILKNATPPSEVSFRLRIASGSLRESEAQQGIAHFIEHMAFRGSTHVPEGEMTKMLQRKGLALGADTNAHTSFTETVYELDLPQADAGLIDTSLMLMREIASELTFGEQAMASERGVVMSEERERDTPGYRVQTAHMTLLADGQLAARRFPIGKMDIIQHATAGVLRDYYAANYRPARTTLIAVGDIDPASLKAKIEARFSDWRPAGRAAPEPDLGRPARRGLTVKAIELPGSTGEISLNWVLPRRTLPDTSARRRRALVEHFAVQILARRLHRLLYGESPPFLDSSATTGAFAQSVSYLNVSAWFSPGKWQEALAAIEQERRRLARYGVSEAELSREVDEMRLTLKDAVAGAGTRKTRDLAVSLLDSLDNTVFITPAGHLALFEASVKNLKAAQVSAAARRLYRGDGPLIFASAPAPLEGGEAALAAEYKKVHAAPVSAPAPEAAIAWPYSSAGTPGEIASRKENRELGTVAVEFANGVRLTVKQTDFRAGEVLAEVRIGNGRLDLPKDRPAPQWLCNVFLAGGLEAIRADDMARALASKRYSLNFFIDDDAFVLKGDTRPEDLGVQLEVLAAYVAHPAYRAGPLGLYRAFELATYTEQDATALAAYRRDVDGLLHPGSLRWAAPGREQLETATVADIKAMLEGPLLRGAIEVTIVGDIAPNAAMEFTAATFGALPQRPAPQTLAAGRAVAFPAAVSTPVERTHKGRADTALAFAAWPTTDRYSGLNRHHALKLLSDILQNRLYGRLRETEGSVYAPSTGIHMDTVFPGYGYIWAEAETPPGEIAAFFAAVAEIAAAIRSGGVTEEELARVRAPLAEELTKAKLTNGYWLAYLSGSQADPRLLDLIRSTPSSYGEVTPDDIKREAALALADDRAWKLAVLPSGGAVAQNAGIPSR